MKCLICTVNTNKYICFYNLISNKTICCKCYESFQYNPQTIKYKNHNVKILFKYNNVFRSLIRLWKIDNEPAANKILANLICKYIPKNKTIIYPPSFLNPSLKKLLDYLNINNQNIFIKEKNYEQKLKKYFSRLGSFKLINPIPKNFLLVDDIYTSGMTIKKSLDLLEEQGYKSIDVIIFASTQEFNNQKQFI